MTWPVIKDAILDLSGKIAPLALMALVLYWLLRKWLSVRLKASVEHEYAEKLESHKAQLRTEHEVAIERLRTDAADLRAIQDVARSSLLAVHTSSQERRLKAIEVVWDATRKLRSNTVSVLTILDCLKREEISTAMNNLKIRPVVEDVTPEKLSALLQDTEGVDGIRPFLGEYLYSLFFGYRAFVGRTLLLVAEGAKKGALTVWFEDGGVLALLKAILSPEEMEEFGRMVLGKFDWARNKIEAKMLAHMSAIISGEASATFNLTQAQRIAEAASRASLPTA